MLYIIRTLLHWMQSTCIAELEASFILFEVGQVLRTPLERNCPTLQTGQFLYECVGVE